MVLLRCALPVPTLVGAPALEVKAVDVACLTFLCQMEVEDAAEGRRKHYQG